MPESRLNIDQELDFLNSLDAPEKQPPQAGQQTKTLSSLDIDSEISFIDGLDIGDAAANDATTTAPSAASRAEGATPPVQGGLQAMQFSPAEVGSRGGMSGHFREWNPLNRVDNDPEKAPEVREYIPAEVGSRGGMSGQFREWNPQPGAQINRVDLAVADQVDKKTEIIDERYPQWVKDLFGQEQVDTWKAMGKTGAKETAKDELGSVESILDKLPFSPTVPLRLAEVYSAVQRLKKGDSVYEKLERDRREHPHPDDRLMEEIWGPNFLRYHGVDRINYRERDEQLVGDYLVAIAEAQVRGRTIPSYITQGVLELPKFMVEFIVTGSTAAVARRAVARAMARLGARKLGGKLAARTARRGAKWFAGATARTFLMEHRVAEGTLRRLLPESATLTETGRMIFGETEEPLTALFKAFGDVYIENLSETAGKGISKAFRRLGGSIKGKLGGGIKGRLGKRIVSAYSRKYPNKNVKNLFTKAGFDGFIEELSEEKLGALLRGAVGVEDYGQEDFFGRMAETLKGMADWRQFLIEAGILAGPTVLRGVAGGLSAALSAYRRDKTRSAMKKAGIPDDQVKSIMDEPDPKKKTDMLDEAAKGTDAKRIRTSLENQLATREMTEYERIGKLPEEERPAALESHQRGLKKSKADIDEIMSQIESGTDPADAIDTLKKKTAEERKKVRDKQIEETRTVRRAITAERRRREKWPEVEVPGEATVERTAETQELLATTLGMSNAEVAKLPREEQERLLNDQEYLQEVSSERFATQTARLTERERERAAQEAMKAERVLEWHRQQAQYRLDKNIEEQRKELAKFMQQEQEEETAAPAEQENAPAEQENAPVEQENAPVDLIAQINSTSMDDLDAIFDEANEEEKGLKYAAELDDLREHILEDAVALEDAGVDSIPSLDKAMSRLAKAERDGNVDLADLRTKWDDAVAERRKTLDEAQPEKEAAEESPTGRGEVSGVAPANEAEDVPGSKTAGKAPAPKRTGGELQVAEGQEVLQTWKQEFRYIRRPRRDNPLYTELYSKEHGAIKRWHFRGDQNLPTWDEALTAAFARNLVEEGAPFTPSTLGEVYDRKLRRQGELDKEENEYWEAAAQDAARDSFRESIEAGIRPDDGTISENAEIYKEVLEELGVDDDSLKSETFENVADDGDDVDTSFDFGANVADDAQPEKVEAAITVDDLTKMERARYNSATRDQKMSPGAALLMIEGARMGKKMPKPTAPDPLPKVETAPDGSIVAGQDVDSNPTDDQKNTGNYKMGHVKVDGLDISIENPVESTRSGTSRDGKEWSIEMQHDYGYIKGTKGRDKDHVDVFIKPGYQGGTDVVYVVNQVDPKTRRFDEHKVMLGFSNAEDAREAYLSNYEDGWKGLGNIVSMKTAEFKSWVFSEDDGPARGRLSDARLQRHVRKAEAAADKGSRPDIRFGYEKILGGGSRLARSTDFMARLSGMSMTWANIEDGLYPNAKILSSADAEKEAEKVDRFRKDFAAEADNKKWLPRDRAYLRSISRAKTYDEFLKASGASDFRGPPSDMADREKWIKAKARVDKKAGKVPNILPSNEAIKIIRNRIMPQLQADEALQATISSGSRDAVEKTAFDAVQKAITEDLTWALAQPEEEMETLMAAHRAINADMDGYSQKLAKELVDAEEGPETTVAETYDPQKSIDEIIRTGVTRDAEGNRVAIQQGPDETSHVELIKKGEGRTRLSDIDHDTIAEAQKEASRYLKGEAPDVAPSSPGLTINVSTLKQSVRRDLFGANNFYRAGVTAMERALQRGKTIEGRLEDESSYGARIVLVIDGQDVPLSKKKMKNRDIAIYFGPQKTTTAATMKGDIPYTRESTATDIRRVRPKGGADTGERVLLANGEVWEYKGISGYPADNRGRVNGWQKVESSIKSAGSHIKKGVANWNQGLDELFGGGQLNSSMGPVPIDGEKYRQAVPHFVAGLKEFQAAGKDIKAFIRAQIQKYGAKIKPYLMRFLQELQSGAINLDATDQTDATDATDATDQTDQTELTPEPPAPPAPAGEESPSLSVARELAEKLASGEEITREHLRNAMTVAFGGSMGQGKYSIKDLNDVLEMAVNLAIMEQGKAHNPRVKDVSLAQISVHQLARLLDSIPSQTNRTNEQQDLQQFSTPPHYSFVANWVANLKPGDAYLEPHAGIGGLATFAKVAGVKQIITNELSDRRRRLLESLGIADVSMGENWEFGRGVGEAWIAAGKMQRPTVVVMNPPFTNAATTNKKSMNVGFDHIDEAFGLLAGGGRLVAIIGGKGWKGESKTMATRLRQLHGKSSRMAVVDVPRSVYQKYGTAFPTRIVVVDKPTKPELVGVHPMKKGDVNNLGELIDFLQEIRDERVTPDTAEGSSGTGSGQGTASDGSAVGAGQSDTGTAPVGSGVTGSGVRTGGKGDTGGGRGTTSRPGDRGSNVGSGDGTVGDGSETTPVDSADDTDGTGAAESPTQEPSGVRRNTARGDVLEGGVFQVYEPEVTVKSAKPHNTELVQTVSMAAVEMPDPNYEHSIPRRLLKSGDLTSAQMVPILYAGRAHETILPNGSRRGFFDGDGTGVGKTRINLGIILDNWQKGRRRHVYITPNDELMGDAIDESEIFGLKDNAMRLSKVARGDGVIPHQDGIMYASYSQIARAVPDVKKDGSFTRAANPNSRTRIEQLHDWLGTDFDGVIVFDESHKAANAADVKGARGTKHASQTARAVIALQRVFPKARVVYASATGATEVLNFVYADRLGLWGHGTAFSEKEEFINALSGGGFLAMEMVARDLKAMGLYVSRTLSFRGVDFRPPNETVHSLSDDQLDVYNLTASSWQTVFRSIEGAIEQTGVGHYSGQKSGNIRGQIAGAQQIFYRQILSAMMMPSVLADMHKQLDAGNSVVVQLVNHFGQKLEDQIKALEADGNPDWDDIDITPRLIILQAVDKNYPTKAYEKFDDDGKEAWRPVMIQDPNDPDKRIHADDPEALAEKKKLLAELALMELPENPLKQIINEFGYENVAEVTGRTVRLVEEKSDDGSVQRIKQPRSKRRSEKDIDLFMSGKKRILAFTAAGATGRSYHAALNVDNQQKRVHYVVQLDWSAAPVVQALGRTHRTNQRVSPMYQLWSTDVLGNKRFMTSVARRLAQLGALTGGERRATTQGLFSEKDNLESKYGERAMRRFWLALRADQIFGVSWEGLLRMMAFREETFTDKDGEFDPDKLPPVKTFLNRMLMLEFDKQNTVFGEYLSIMEELIENDIQRGVYDAGMQEHKADKIEKKSDDVIYTHPGTKAVTRLIEAEASYDINFTHFNELDDLYASKPLHIVRNIRSGLIYALYSGIERTDRTTGKVVSTFRRVGPHKIDNVDREKNTVIPRNEVPKKTNAPKIVNVTQSKEPLDQGGEGHTLTISARGAVHADVWERARKAIHAAIPGSTSRMAHESTVLVSVPEGTQFTKAQAQEIIDQAHEAQYTHDLLQRGNLIELDPIEAEKEWEAQIKAADPMEHHTEHFLTGIMLPVWDRLPRTTLHAFRVNTVDNDSFIGLAIPPDQVAGVQTRFGLDVQVTPQSALKVLSNVKASIELANGWRLKVSTVAGERRYEVVGPKANDVSEWESHIGGFTETIGYKPRFFIPTTEEDAIAGFEKLFAKSPAVNVNAPAEQRENAVAPEPAANEPPAAANAANEAGTSSASRRKGYGPTLTKDDGDAPRARSSKAVPPPDKLSVKALDDFSKVLAPSARSDQSRAAGRVILFRNAEIARAAEVARAKLKDAIKYFRRMSNEQLTDFINRMENGEKQDNPRLQEFSDKLRSILDAKREEVRDLGTGALTKFYENYFPHIWKDAKNAKDNLSRIMGRRPLEGSKSFLKKRKHFFFSDALDAGLEPVSWNPVELVLLKLHEMDRYIMAQKIVQDLKEMGLARFFYVKASKPDGYIELDDPVFRVFHPPHITVKEAFDNILVERLTQFAESLGIDTKRVMKMRGRTWGYQQGNKIRTRFAGPESVLIHEIGHALGTRYGVFDWIQNSQDKTREGIDRRRVINAEWRALADLRYEGQQVSENYKRMVRKKAEKEAVLLEALLHAPDRMKQIAPNLTAEFQRFLGDRPELRELLDLKPSLVLGTGKGNVEIPGVTQLGSYYAPEPVARILKNFLSPGIRDSGVYDWLREAGNVLNQAQLGLSAFHLGNTTLDTMASHMGLGLRQVVATKGQNLQGLWNVVSGVTGIAPLMNMWRGSKLFKAYQSENPENIRIMGMNISDPTLRTMVDAVVYAGGRGRMDPFYYNDAVRTLIETKNQIVNDKGFRKLFTGAKVPWRVFAAGLEISAKPLMEFVVPRQKLGLFYVMAQHEMARAASENLSTEQLHQRLVEVWANVDNRMGQLVYDNLFWNKVFKDSAMLAVRSVGWNLGTWREYGGSVVDVFNAKERIGRGDAWLSQKQAYVIGSVITATVWGAVFCYLISGKWPWEDEDSEWPRDYFFPRTGRKNPDGSDERITLPTYMKDMYAYLKGFKHGVGSGVKQIASTMSHKVHPLMSGVAEILENEDFYGVEIRGEDDPYLQQGKDLSIYIGKMFIPFAVRNYRERLKTGSSPLSAAWSFAGIIKAPASVSRTGAQEELRRIMAGKVPQGKRTKEQYRRSELRKQLIQRVRAGEDLDRIPEATRNFSFKQRQAIKREGSMDYDESRFRRLSLSNKLKVFALMNDHEQAKVREALDASYMRRDRSDPRNKEMWEEPYRALTSPAPRRRR